jgi:hypothetical protein
MRARVHMFVIFISLKVRSLSVLLFSLLVPSAPSTCVLPSDTIQHMQLVNKRRVPSVPLSRGWKAAAEMAVSVARAHAQASPMYGSRVVPCAHRRLLLCYQLPNTCSVLGRRALQTVGSWPTLWRFMAVLQ